MPDLIDPDNPRYNTGLAKGLRDPDADPHAPDSAINQILASIITNTAMKDFVTPELVRSNWAEYMATADKFNQPGKFTTLIAYEWTSIPNGRNMHRNVFFRDKGPEAPFSAFDSIQPADLWTYQEKLRAMGIDSLAIPHNGNVSDGWMYSPNTFLHGPMDKKHA